MWITVYGHKHIYTREGGIEVAVTELVERLSKKHSIAVIDRAVGKTIKKPMFHQL